MRSISSFVIILISLSWCIASKEYLDRLERLMENPDFLRKVVKRLDLGIDDINIGEDGSTTADSAYVGDNTNNRNGNYGIDKNVNNPSPVPKDEDKAVKDVFGNTCQYNTRSESIIETTRSLKAGAFFLEVFTNFTAQKCVSACCYTQGCNLAVYENKSNHTCYLFDCGKNNKCTFSHHGEYLSMSFPHIANQPSPSKDQEKHEDELEGLGKSNGILPPEKAPVQITTSAPVTRKVPPLEVHPAQAVVCGESQFKCVSSDSEKLKCYDLSARCDSVMQCADGSDEEDCPAKSPAAKNIDSISSKKGPAHEYNNDKGYVYPKTPTPKPHVPSTVKTPAVPTVKPMTESINTETEKPSPKTVEKDEFSKEEETNSIKSESDQNNKSEIAPEKSEKTLDAAANNNTGKSDKTIVVVEEVDNVVEEDGLIVVPSPTDNAQGPIVALSLGLAITLILLIFVGCRLRNVKRRLRKGRVLHSNEADYLINGMYL